MLRAFVADTMTMKVQAVVIVVGGVYVVMLPAMFAYGWGSLAAYLAIPGWYIAAYPFFAVASVVPGTIDSPLAKQMQSPQARADRFRTIPLGRLGYASEMADLAVFLASPAASFITGQTINCCGGFSINSFVVPAGMSETLREARERGHPV